MTIRRCLEPGCPELVTSGSRCAEHRAVQRAKYRGAWPHRSRAAVSDHRARVGDWCPGWRCAPHEASDLVLDHAAGVMCRACNTRKRNLGDG
jgi:hypothetical protein